MGTKKTKGADELRETFRSFDCLAESGEYIRHPVLYELSHKYGLQTESVPEAALPNKLEELKELIRREIRKELKIKEGAEKLREASKDRKSLSDVAHIVKKSNSKLSELQAELQELESQIILTQGQGEPPKNGHGIFLKNNIFKYYVKIGTFSMTGLNASLSRLVSLISCRLMLITSNASWKSTMFPLDGSRANVTWSVIFRGISGAYKFWRVCS
ncbi:unnamed protein product, partial [Nesidiocoris tenuis]